MHIGLYHGVSALDVNERRMDTITANLANVGTAGFKRLSTSTHAFEAPAESGRATYGLRSRQTIDFGQGSLNRTGNATDLALMGDGFFAVDAPSGEIYTRKGDFHFDQDGVLKTVEGYPVVWAGARGTLDPTGDPLVVDMSGAVRQGANDVGRLRLVAFGANERLGIDRQGYFHASPLMAREPAAAEVHQGALEASNVAAMDELVAMIQVQRSFQMASNLLSSIDQTYRRLVTPR